MPQRLTVCASLPRTTVRRWADSAPIFRTQTPLRDPCQPHACDATPRGLRLCSPRQAHGPSARRPPVLALLWGSGYAGEDPGGAWRAKATTRAQNALRCVGGGDAIQTSTVGVPRSRRRCSPIRSRTPHTRAAWAIASASASRHQLHSCHVAGGEDARRADHSGGVTDMPSSCASPWGCVGSATRSATRPCTPSGGSHAPHGCHKRSRTCARSLVPF